MFPMILSKDQKQNPELWEWTIALFLTNWSHDPFSPLNHLTFRLYLCEFRTGLAPDGWRGHTGELWTSPGRGQQAVIPHAPRMAWQLQL